MADISAALVMNLRKMSGQGMMDCKAALAETDGNLDEAMTLLRKKGLATMAKRAGRETSEGRVVSCTQNDGKLAAMATLCCETDFVAKSDDFISASEALKNYILTCPSDDNIEELLKTTDTSGKELSQLLTETVSKLGEKIEIGDYARFKINGSGLIGLYVHFNGKIGSMVEIQTGDDAAASNPEMKQMAADIAMHITAIKPIALDESSIAAEVIEKEKAIAAEQVKNKPANIIDKIVDGKMRKFYAENCLLAQGFVKEEKKTVAEVLAQVAKSAGTTAAVKRFVRLEIG